MSGIINLGLLLITCSVHTKKQYFRAQQVVSYVCFKNPLAIRIFHTVDVMAIKCPIVGELQLSALMTYKIVFFIVGYLKEHFSLDCSCRTQIIY